MTVALPDRLLLGSGPSPVPERVLRALGAPTIGFLDPAFGGLLEETTEMLREVFGTPNRATLPISGTGSGGMDALVSNFVEPGDRVVCGVNGLFGERMADELGRAGAEVVRVEAEWGRAIEPERLLDAAAGGLDALFVVHGETSTGVCQPLHGLGEACREHGALPHAVPRDVEIPQDTLVVVDWGCVLDGYCSDCTRTFATGDPGDQAREVYELVRSTQAEAREAVRAGADCKAVDSVARERISEAGHGEEFGHGLGHGVGLEVHEEPRLSPLANGELRAGNVVTVEPGVYVQGSFGVRIEDLVIVGEDGVRNLSGFPKTLVTVD